ncbi:MAG: molecular chaperone DnaJ [Agathobacter sp.]
MTLCEERRELEEEKRLFDIEKRDFYRRVEIEDRRLEQEKNLFDMKFKILEEELVKLAAEKAEVEKKKAFYDMVDDFQARNYHRLTDSQMSTGEMLFRGVANQQSLKKRYKDLIKIFHPDNADGDNLVILEINKEYDYLSQYLV